MTTYTGKDVTFKINGTQVAYASEVSLEVDNGQKEVKVLSLENYKELAWTQYKVSGSCSMFYNNYDILNDVVAYGTTKTLSLLFGSDFTVTLNNVRYGEYTINISLDEPIKIEVNFEVETITVS